jgi:hypothetical protein
LDVPDKGRGEVFPPGNGTDQEEHMKNGTLKGMAIAGALATLLAPAVSFAAKGKTAKGVHCEGSNDCKGKGNCKSAAHDCKGKNDCKGQSFTMEKDSKSCEDKGGKAATSKAKT